MSPVIRRVLIALVLLACIAAVATRFLRHDAPAGQPPLAILTEQTLGELRDDFNAAADATRIILLLSPT
jgi:hypothetical protein